MDRLLASDGLTECFSLLSVTHRLFEGSATDTDGGCRHTWTCPIKGLHGDLEAFTLVTNTIFDGDFDILVDVDGEYEYEEEVKYTNLQF